MPATAQFAALGETVQLSAEVRDQNGNVVAGAALMWSSSDASVATVDAAGRMTAAANGTATITATAGGVSRAVAVTILYESKANRGTNKVASDFTRDLATTGSRGTLAYTRTILPVGDLNVRRRDPYFTSADKGAVPSTGERLPGPETVCGFRGRGA